MIRSILLEQRAVLLLQAANLVNVNRLELTLDFLLVRWELLLLHGLQADCGIVTNAYDQDTTAFGLAVFVVLVGKGDVDLGDVIRRVRWRIGILEHGLAVAGDVVDAGAAIMRCLYFQAWVG